VAQAVKTTGGAAGFTAKELNKMAAGLQKITGIGDEKILKDVTLQFLTFSKIAGTAFERAQVAALDLAAVLGTDVKSIAIQLGKALEDPIKGISALSRSGIIFTDQQKKQIKVMAESNDLLGAQGIILDEIEAKYGGQAKALEDATSGMGRFASAVGDLLEKIGTPIFSAIGSIFGGLTSTIETLSGAMETNVDKWETTKSNVESLDSKLPSLIKTYDELKGKTTLNKDEQTKLNTTIQAIAGLLPQAVTEYDKYGKALDINKTKVYELWTAERKRLQWLNRDAIEDIKDSISTLEDEQKAAQNKLARALKTGTVTEIIGGEAVTFKVQDSDIIRFTEDVKNATVALEGANLQLDYLLGGKKPELNVNTGEGGGGGGLDKTQSAAEKLANTEKDLNIELQMYLATLSKLDPASIAFSLVKDKITEIRTELANLRADTFNISPRGTEPLPVGINVPTDLLSVDMPEKPEIDLGSEINEANQLEAAWLGVGSAMGAISNLMARDTAEYKAFATIQAIIATALAVTKALPNIPLAIAVGAMGAVQLATIMAAAQGGTFENGKKIASFAGGGDFTVPAGFPNDSYLMRVQSGERVNVTPSGRVGDESKLLAEVAGGIRALNKNLAMKNMTSIVNVDIDGKKLVKQVTKPNENRLRRTGLNLDSL